MTAAQYLLGVLFGWWLSGGINLALCMRISGATAGMQFRCYMLAPLAAIGGCWSCELLMVLLGLSQYTPNEDEEEE